MASNLLDFLSFSQNFDHLTITQNLDILTMSQNINVLTKTNFEVNKIIIKMARFFINFIFFIVPGLY